MYCTRCHLSGCWYPPCPVWPFTSCLSVWLNRCDIRKILLTSGLWPPFLFCLFLQQDLVLSLSYLTPGSNTCPVLRSTHLCLSFQIRKVVVQTTLHALAYIKIHLFEIKGLLKIIPALGFPISQRFTSLGSLNLPDMEYWIQRCGDFFSPSMFAQ